MIIYKTSTSTNYYDRTKLTAAADVTFAFATDFNTKGEVLTRRLVNSHNKLYLNTKLSSNLDISDIDFDYIKFAVNNTIEENNLKKYSINIAGNGIYTLVKYGISQSDIDKYMFNFLSLYVELVKSPIEFVISGGQSGVDEAGSKAADKLGLNSFVYAPKYFRFRDINNIDIYDEYKFKERFKC